MVAAMNGIGAATFVKARLLTITALSGRVFLGRTSFEPGQALPLATVIGIETEIARRACATHVITDTIIVEGHFNATAGDVLTPGHSLLASFQSALKSSDCDYTFGNQFIDLTFAGRSVFPREDGSSIGVCQLRLVARYHEDF